MAREPTPRGSFRGLSNRRSLRLTHFDYGEPGAYFVTLCVADRSCIFGSIADGTLEPSLLGRIVESCLLAIPRHFLNARVGAYQIMPNHLHAIIEIVRRVKHDTRRVGVEYIQPLHTSVQSRRHGDTFQHIQSGSLPSIVRTFKGAVSREARRRHIIDSCFWQRSYHDRIIRDDIEQYFIERYITLNPLLWRLDRNNPHQRTTTPDEVRRELCTTCHLAEDEAERVIEAMEFS